MKTSAIFLLLGLLFFAGPAGAQMTALPNAQGATIDQFGYCRNVSNNSGLQIMIPYRSSGEWTSFFTHLPPGVGASPCEIWDGWFYSLWTEYIWENGSGGADWWMGGSIVVSTGGYASSAYAGGYHYVKGAFMGTSFGGNMYQIGRYHMSP